MSLIAMPSTIALKGIEWSQSDVEQVNRSPWSGRTRIASFGAAARWSATATLPALFGDDHRVWNAFAFKLRGRVNVFALPAVEANQHALTGFTPLVAAGSTGFTLAVKSLPASKTVLREGHLVTVALASGDMQLVGLTSDLVSDGSGNASATLATALRETALVNGAVELLRPYGLMRAVNPRKWTAEEGQMYGHSLTAEEAF